MKRLRLVLTALVLPAAFVVGCQQHRFMTEADFKHYQKQAMKAGDCAPPEPDPFSPLYTGDTISSAINPEGKHRPMSLIECIALALENGRTGELFDRGGTGAGLRTNAISAGRVSPSNSSDSIRVFSYDPALQAIDIEQSLAKFDARWQVAQIWSRLDQPRSLQASLAGAGTLEREQAQFETLLLKPLPTGGLAGITFRTDYDFSNLNSRFGIENPSYTPVFELSWEQPLLQGNGVFINQLRDRHPGGIQNQINPGGRVPGILLTRIAADQVGLEFENRIHALLYEVEQAYWQLYCAYWDHYSREIAMRQAHAAWQIAKIKSDLGSQKGAEFAQIAQQFHLFRVQRLGSLGRGSGSGRPGILEAERRLRYIIGLSVEDGYRLIPIDEPNVTPYVPDWGLSLRVALRRRPELIQVRLDIQANQLAVLREKDFLLPDLRFFMRYNVNALGDHLDGKDSGSAFRNLAANQFNDWNVGLRMEVPLGYREAHAEVRRVQLQLAQRLAWLQDNESKVAFSLGRSYREILESSETIRIQRARRLEAATQLDLQNRLYVAGTGTVDVLLEAQRNWADAMRDEHFAICDYNVALVDFDRQKGTILDRSNVSILEGPIPACAQARASAHIRERAHSLLLKQPLENAPTLEEVCTSAEGPVLLHDPRTVSTAASIPALMDQQKKLPTLPEKLPLATEKAAMPASLQDLMDQSRGAATTEKPAPAGPVKATVIMSPEATQRLKSGPAKASVVIPEEAPAPQGSPVKAKISFADEPAVPQGRPGKASVTFPVERPDPLSPPPR